MKFILSIILITISFSAFSQAVQYSYDDAGNRIQRKQIVLARVGKTTPKPSEPVTETVGNFSFSFYPNPTTSEVRVEVDKEFLKEGSDKKAILYDLNGRLLQQKEIISSFVPFDLSEYKPGIYILKITGKEFSEQWRVVKQ